MKEGFIVLLALSLGVVIFYGIRYFLNNGDESAICHKLSTKDRIEKYLIVIFWISLVLAVFGSFLGILLESWILIGVIGFFLLATGIKCYNNIPPVHVGLPISYILGRFWSFEDEQGMSNPIARPASEGISFTYPWRRYDVFSRQTDDLKIISKKFQTKQGSVNLSGMITVRATGKIVHRLAELEKSERETLLVSRVNRIILNHILRLNLETALNQKTELEKRIQDVLTSPAKVKDPSKEERRKAERRVGDERRLSAHKPEPDSRTGRDRRGKDRRVKEEYLINKEIFGEPVTYAEQNFGLEVLKVIIEDIDPTAEIQKRRDSIVSEEYKRRQRAIQLSVDDLIKDKYPDLSDDARVAVLQILDGDVPATKAIKSFEIPEIDKVLKVVKEIGMALVTKNSS